jgi:hypothetical protein
VHQTDSRLDVFRYWARIQFNKYKNSIAYIASEDDEGSHNIGTCFHVGEGVFVTARHVIESRRNIEIGFDDPHLKTDLLFGSHYWSVGSPHTISITQGPFYHSDASVDVACFRANVSPDEAIPLGGHFDEYLSEHEFLLNKTLVVGYPSIPLTDRPVLVASTGEVNSIVDLYNGRHPHFLISTMARGGFSGGPVLIAYNELNEDSGTAALGLVTQSLVKDFSAPEYGYMAVLTVEPIYACLESAGVLPKCQLIRPED